MFFNHKPIGIIISKANTLKKNPKIGTKISVQNIIMKDANDNL